MEKIWSAQSHLSSELLFTCGISGFVRAELLHSSKRGVIVLFSCEHTDTHIHSKVAAAITLRVITASQQHGFPLTVLCRRLELNCPLPVSCGSLLSQSELFSSLVFFSGLLNRHPLKSRLSASSPAPHTMPAHGPIAEAIKLSTSLLLLPPPLKSSPLLTSSPLNSFPLPLPTPPLSSLSGVPGWS